MRRAAVNLGAGGRWPTGWPAATAATGRDGARDAAEGTNARRVCCGVIRCASRLSVRISRPAANNERRRSVTTRHGLGIDRISRTLRDGAET